jgi:hypothetical protein
LAQLAGDFQTATVAVHDVLYNRKAKPDTANGPRPMSVDTVKPFRQAGDMMRRNALSLIGYGQLCTLPPDRRMMCDRINRNHHTPAVTAVFQRVFNQINYHLT